MALSLLARNRLLDTPAARARSLTALTVVAQENLHAALPAAATQSDIERQMRRARLALEVLRAPGHWLSVFQAGFTAAIAPFAGIANIAVEDEELGPTKRDNLDDAILAAFRSIFDNYLDMTIPR